MPRGFTEREKAHIKATLLAKARESLAAHGLKKTNVEELAQAAGISKGAFYQFYGSKEELLIEVVEQFEAEFQRNVLAEIAAVRPATPAAVKALLLSMVVDWQADPMFAKITSAEIVLVMQRVPPEIAERGIRTDDAFAAQIIAAWAEAGLVVEREPRMFAALCRALFFVSLHRADFAADMYGPMIDVLSELIAGYLVGRPAQGGLA
ncbi:MAG TPA: TetR/AcrR family transcriptional regulator [Herpetosiphonaceae bacterium]